MRFCLLSLLSLLFAGSYLLGGSWLASPFLLAALAIPADEAIGDDWSIVPGWPTFLTAILYLQLPLIMASTFLFAYYLSDWTFLGETVNRARESTALWQLLIAGLLLGMLYGAGGINVAHELVHRSSPWAVAVGRWLLSFSFDTGFALEHVYGHHVHVGTERDPATARRGQGFWSFLVGMIVIGNINAFKIEKSFLEKKGRPLLSPHNRFLRGHLMSITWLVLFFAAAGWRGMLVFMLLALNGKMYLEMTNYIEHYGLVREPGTRVAGRHSWNSARRLSNWVLFNLPRHPDHHLRPLQRYWELKSRSDAPQLPYGYFLMTMLAAIPPLFRWRMKPLLEEWDNRFATPGERAIAAAHVLKPSSEQPSLAGP